MSQKSSDNSFEELYLKEKKRSTIFMGATIVLVIVSAGLGIWGSNRSSGINGQPDGINNGTRFNGQAPPGGFGNGGPGGFRGGFEVGQFFNEDGSVNQDQVDQLLSRFPQGADSGFIDIFSQNIDQAVEDGEISESQAEALKEALNETIGQVNES